MEVGPYVDIDIEEMVSTPDLLEIMGDRVVTVFGITEPIDKLVVKCPVDLNASHITLEQKNAFVIKAANESGLEIEAQYAPYFSEVLNSFGLEPKFTIAPATPDKNDNDRTETDNKHIDQATDQKTISSVDRRNHIKDPQRDLIQLVIEDQTILEPVTSLNDLSVPKALKEQIKPDEPDTLKSFALKAPRLYVNEIKAPESKLEAARPLTLVQDQEQDRQYDTPSSRQEFLKVTEVVLPEIPEFSIIQDRSEYESSIIVSQIDVNQPDFEPDNSDITDIKIEPETVNLINSYENEYFNHLVDHDQLDPDTSEDVVLNADMELPDVTYFDELDGLSIDPFSESYEHSAENYDVFVEALVELSEQLLSDENQMSADVSDENSVFNEDYESDDIRDVVHIIAGIAQELTELDFSEKQLILPIIENIFIKIMSAELLETDSEDIIELEQACVQLFELLNIKYDEKTITRFLQVLKYADFKRISAEQRQPINIDLEHAGTHEIKYPTNYITIGFINSNTSLKQVIGTFVMACIKSANIQPIKGIASQINCKYASKF